MSSIATHQALIAYELIDDDHPEVTVIEFQTGDILGPLQARDLRDQLDSRRLHGVIALDHEQTLSVARHVVRNSLRVDELHVEDLSLTIPVRFGAHRHPRLVPVVSVAEVEHPRRLPAWLDTSAVRHLADLAISGKRADEDLGMSALSGSIRDPFTVRRKARMDVAATVDGEPLRLGAIVLARPQIAEVAEDNLTVMVIGMPGQFDLGSETGSRKETEQQR